MTETISNFHGIEETLKDPPPGANLYVGKKNPRITALVELARAKKVPVTEAGEAELVRLSNGREQRGALLVLPEGRKLRETSLEEFLDGFEADQALVVLLDGVTDPQNYGAILRSADQFSAELVLIPARRSASDTPAVFAASAGAAAWVPHAVVTNLNRAVKQLKDAGFWIYGADMNGTSAAKTKLTGKVALVLGSEGKGISRLTRELCDQIVSIPTTGQLDSLNVSVSAGILMYEVRRQQG
ncbi:MAG: 23S rRNA (guanosine(2251)-2'-O)-methyltransferase RlmB [Spirochaetales bacterium]